MDEDEALEQAIQASLEAVREEQERLYYMDPGMWGTDPWD